MTPAVEDGDASEDGDDGNAVAEGAAIAAMTTSRPATRILRIGSGGSFVRAGRL